MAKQVQAQLKETQVTPVGTMEDSHEAVLPGKGAEINDPEIGETSGEQDTHQAVRFSDMTFIKVKATALLNQ